MVRVLLVDDDKWVRLGLKSAMPWSEFGLEVVGDAATGESALEFLSRHDVDLMIVDLSMPIMSGQELMRVARTRYPDLCFAVLSFHDEVEHVQEAFRLGALDYVTKDQLEGTEMREFCRRVAERMQQRVGLPSEQEYVVDRALVVFDGDDARVIPPESDAAGRTPVRSKAHWSNSFVVTGLAGHDTAEVRRLVGDYCRTRFLYDTTEPSDHPVRPLSWIAERLRNTRVTDFQTIRDRIESLDWSTSSTQTCELLVEVKDLAMPPEELRDAMRSATRKWNERYRAIAATPLPNPGPPAHWNDVAEWFEETARTTIALVANAGANARRATAIHKAMEIMNAEYADDLTAGAVAERVNLSRSHFHASFKELTGRTFSAFLRHARVERARDFLLRTEKPIQLVAELVGYLDAKHFSHVFRLETGELPSEFRRARRERGQSSTSGGGR